MAFGRNHSPMVGGLWWECITDSRSLKDLLVETVHLTPAVFKDRRSSKTAGLKDRLVETHPYSNGFATARYVVVFQY